MPTVDVTIGPLDEARKRRLVRDLTAVFTTHEVPATWVTIVFRHVGPRDVARGGEFPWWDADGGSMDGPGFVDITIGDLDEAEKRRIAAGVAASLAAAGIAEPFIAIHFRHVSGRDVAEAGGTFPFRPPGAPW